MVRKWADFGLALYALDQNKNKSTLNNSDMKTKLNKIFPKNYLINTEINVFRVYSLAKYIPHASH